MARMLGYRELPEEQFKTLRKVFAYIDSDGDGKITPAELRAVVERFGLKMAASQLEMYVSEFDADGDGLIDLTEFSNLMSKLHGRAAAAQRLTAAEAQIASAIPAGVPTPTIDDAALFNYAFHRNGRRRASTSQ